VYYDPAFKYASVGTKNDATTEGWIVGAVTLASFLFGISHFLVKREQSII
jgi:hypothetical protein